MTVVMDNGEFLLKDKIKMNIQKINIKHIVVEHNGKKMSLPLNINDNVDFALLQKYYPDAAGLTYEKNGMVYAVNCSDKGRELIITNQENEIVYNIYKDGTELLKSTETSGTSFLSHDKARRISEIVNKIRENTSTKRKKSNDQYEDEKYGKILKKKERIIHVGWLHKTDGSQKYSQMKRPVGGIRVLKLDAEKVYSSDDIINEAKEIFCRDRKCFLKFDSNIILRLGHFDGSIIIFDNLWEYFKINSMIPYKSSLYLLSSIKNNRNSTISSTVTNLELMDVQHEVTPEMEFNTDNNNIIQIFYHDIRYSKYSKSISVCEKDKTDLYMSLSIDQQNLTNIEDFEPLDFGYNISKIIKNGETLLQISFEESDHSRKFSFPFSEEFAGEHKILFNLDTLYGRCDNKLGLGMITSCDDSCQPTFIWYKNDNIFKKGKFLYWINIPDNEEKCTWSCTVECTGNKNSSLEKFGYVSLQNINDVNTPSEEENSNNLNQEEENLENLFNTHSVENVENKINIHSLENLCLPKIIKNDIIFSKIILGAGSQGKVRKAKWLGTDVAVKSIRIVNKCDKFVIRELQVLAHIRHPYITQIMAICIEPRQLHILMEFVDGDNLYNIIFDEDLNKEFNLNVRNKHQIAKQILQAVNYLHQQNNPIVHRDIKPDNILISKHLTVKLCDLGLCVFKNMMTALRTTVGKKILKGTLLYMAPEIILQKSECTIYSDTWAVACTLVEMYNEENIWNLQQLTEDNFKEKLQAKVEPDLRKIPIEVKDTIKECFSYELLKRPKISDILNIYETNNF